MLWEDFFAYSVNVLLSPKDGLQHASVPALAGAVSEVVSGLLFWLYGRTMTQLGEFHRRLEALQRYLLANTLCDYWLRVFRLMVFACRVLGLLILGAIA